MGGNVKVQQDRVTVYLRAVSSQTGQIIKTVHASRNILSEQVDGGLYRFVKFKKLLEIEAGLSTNEPVQMCVLEAIEKAVLALIIEGIIDKYWSLENELDMNSPVITEYLKERESGGNFEKFPVESANVTKFGVGLSVGTQLTGLDGDRKIEPLVKNQFQYFFNPFISGILGVNVGRINSEYLESELSLTIDLKGSFDLFPQFRVSPYLISGAGIIKTWVKEPECGPIKEKYPLGIIPAFICGCGLRYRFDNNKSLIMAAENHVTFQEIDGNEEKEKASKLITLAIGMSFSLSGKTR
jgi:curli production assembly/transport component CsgG